MQRSILLALGAVFVAACSERNDPLSANPGIARARTIASQQGTPPFTLYSGRATVVTASILGTTTVLADAGPLPPEGGAAQSSAASGGVPGVLTANALHATTIGENNDSRSEATLGDLSLTVGAVTIGADFIGARAEALCTNGVASVSGSSEFTGLVINGTAVPVSGAPNQVVAIAGGQVIVNEQTSIGSGDITVNALHVIVSGSADIIIASAHADIECGESSCTFVGDFVTGGGWITGTPSGARGNFGVAGGIKNDGLWGHLTYIDHGTGMMVKGTGVTAYEPVDSVTRRIRGTADIDGNSGYTYEVIVSDNGEPGRNDRFSISLSSGYFAGGTLNGGNIQLHKPATCP